MLIFLVFDFFTGFFDRLSFFSFGFLSVLGHQFPVRMVFGFGKRNTLASDEFRRFRFPAF
jgi:hypothetical protein